MIAALVLAAVLTGHPSVIDGDTLELHGTRIRLWGVDSPEGRQECNDAARKAWRCGQQAALALSDFIGSRTVTCEARNKDQYGRTVARCRIETSETAKAADLGDFMVSNGWALDYREYSRGAYKAAEEQARRDQRGVWVGTLEAPWDWRRAHRSRKQ